MLTINKVLHKLRGEGLGAVLVRGSSGFFPYQRRQYGAQLLVGHRPSPSAGDRTLWHLYLRARLDSGFCLCCPQLGFKNSLVRFMPAYMVKEQWSLLRGLLTKSMQYVFTASLLLAGVAALVIWQLRGSLGAEQATTLWISLALLPVSVP